MLFLLGLETFILSFWFQDYVLAGFLALFSLWLIADIFIFFKLFGVAMNIVAILSMIWVVYSGKLLQPLF